MNKNFIVVIIVLIGLIPGWTYAQKQQALEVNTKAVNFILMGDWGRNGEDHQKEVAEQMGKTAALAGNDFIVSAGDNFYPKGVVSEYDPLWKYSFEDIYTAFRLQWDWYPVLGNHDYGSNPDAQVAYSNISRRWRMPARYYAKKFNINGDTTTQLLILFIDTVPLIPSYYRGAFHNMHAQDSSAQKAWIENELASASPHVKWKLVVGHHPMYTGGGREDSPDTKAIRRLQPLLEKYGVDAYLAGHEHSLQHIKPAGDMHHFISGAASERTPVKALSISKFAASEYGFMLFTLTKEELLVQVVDYEGNIIYKTLISK